MKTATKKASARTEAFNIHTNGNAHQKTFTVLPIESIALSGLDAQARRRAHIKPEDISDLAASIKANGLIQPITVRPKPAGHIVGAFKFPKATHEIVCGECRYLAVREAGLDSIDVVIRDLSDITVLEIQTVENSQRKDPDPIDEALNFKDLIDLGHYTIHDLALKLGRPEKFIRQRLRLNDLIPEVLDEVSKGYLPLGHAMEIAKYPAETQKVIHGQEWAYEDKYGDPEEWTTRPLAHFKDEIRDEISLKLSTAAFDIADGTLHPEGLACGSCPQRTGFEPLLFEEELADGDSCLNKACYEAKTLVQLTRQRAAIAKLLPNPKKLSVEKLTAKVPLVTDGWYSSYDGHIFEKGEKVLERQKFLDKAECNYATPALIIKGERKGQQTFICNDGHCKKHNKKEASSSSNNSYQLQTKENEFQCSVANAVRRKIFLESATLFENKSFWSDPDLMLNLVYRLWAAHLYQAKDVIDSWDANAPTNAGDEKKVKKYLSAVMSRGEDEISQLIFLLIYGKEGFSSWRVADQSRVKEVNDRYAKLNYQLIDAETRVELAPKEFKTAAKTYLKAVQSGIEAEIPHFWYTEKKDDE